MVKVILIAATIKLKEYTQLELVDFPKTHLFYFSEIDYELY
jgi:hypothetical protein